MDQFPYIKIGTDSAGPADPGSGLYYDPQASFEGVHFLEDLIGNSDSETKKI